MALRIIKPLVIKAIPGGFKITDGGKRDLVYVYAEADEANALAGGRLNGLEAKELARRIARFLTDEVS